MKLMMILSMLCLMGLMATAQTTPNKLTLSHVSLSAQVDLGEVTVTYHITPENRSANVCVQMYVHRLDIKYKQQWDLMMPQKSDGSPLVLNLFKGIDNTGKFVIPLKKGAYGTVRLFLFHSPDGKSADFSDIFYDSAADANKRSLALNVTVTAEDKRITSPTLVIGKNVEAVKSENGTYTVTIPGIVKIPAGYETKDNGLWAMAKGDYFKQIWVELDKAQPSGNATDPYSFIPVSFTLDNAKPGLWNVQFGLFKSSFGDPLQWIYPGLDFEVGGDVWVKKAEPARIPARLRVRNGRFETVTGKPYDFYADLPQAKKAVTFVRGGNYGNAITWTLRPQLNSPGYFVLLKDLGCCFLRFNFNSDRFLDEPVYRHAVDQIVQNIWEAGLYPILCPQDLPEGATLEKRTELGLRVVQMMATQYKGKSVWLEICNEPHEFETWAAWKPVAVRYAKAIRAIDPEAFVLVPFENYGKDGRGAAASPITDIAIDLYDGHAYVKPEEVTTLFGPPIKAGLPLILGEYGGGADYLSLIDAELQKLPSGLMAASPWAFTVQGQDSLPLIADGESAELKFTSAGQVIANDYALWNAGKKKK